MNKPVVLAILDGVGIREEEKGNAFKIAKTPFIDSLTRDYACSKLDASGEAVGLLPGIMGNSEVGHMNIGAGKIVYQPSMFINNEINNGEFFKNENINRAINYAVENNVSVHLLGLVSDAGVHSLFSHLFALIDTCKLNGVNNLYIHGFSDGRDTSPKSGIEFFKRLQDKLDEVQIGKIATVCGRYYAMDRDNRWDRVKQAYDAMVLGIGEYSSSALETIAKSYENDVTDEFIVPTIIDKEGLIKKGDVVLTFNFRPDRLREILTALSNPEFNDFEVEHLNMDVTTLMPVAESVICKNAYKNQEVNKPLGVVLAENNVTQLRIAETEKYAHVTYFFDGGIERELNGASRILINSPKVSTYDLSPRMSAQEITDNLLSELDKKIHDVVILNYANGDMLGHTGNMDATIESLEFLDECVHKIHDKVMELGGTLIVTADHGNCELMIDENNEVVTSHTTNKVPFVVCNKDISLNDGKLSDIAPTILEILNINKPEEMSGVSLIRH